MTKIFLIICLILLGFEQTKGQLKMNKAEARETMSEMAFTVEKKIEQKGQYQFIHYTNTKVNMETILRINKAEICDQLITVLPIAEWDKYLKNFKEGVTKGSLTNKPSGNNTWIQEDGTTISMIPQSNKNTFSIVVSPPEAKG